ncbi:MAG: prolipoprotein diacylglyceryl transferase [Clostridia bacterium]|nr:prolipoprotein diacylglyceryl transferase [Clostridia bacterium]
MYPVLFQMGGLSIYSWGASLAVAVLVGTYLAAKEARRHDIDGSKIMDLVLAVVVGGLVGGRLFYVLVYDLQNYLANPLDIFRLWEGGLVFYGGLIGGVGAGFWYVRRANLPFWSMADLVAPFLALGYGIVRLGCFANGCCYGKPTEGSWGVIFPHLDDIARHPTQIYSSLTAFLLFGFLHYLLRNKKFNGQVFLVYVILYGIIRSFIEAFRENLAVWGSVTVAQLVSGLLLVGAALFYIYRQRVTPAN